MSALQQELIDTTSELSDISLEKLIDYTKTFIVPFDKYVKHQSDSSSATAKRKLGIFKGENLIAEGYDFDESNEEIAEMFGVNET